MANHPEHTVFTQSVTQTPTPLIQQVIDNWQHYDGELKLALTVDELTRVNSFVAREFHRLYPDYELPEVNPYLQNGITVYADDGRGGITACVNISFGGELGFPEGRYFTRFLSGCKKPGENCLQVGRFAIKRGGSVHFVRAFMQLFYLIARWLGRDMVLGVIPAARKSLHCDRFGARVVDSDVVPVFGGDSRFLPIVWDFRDLSDVFYRFIGEPRCRMLKQKENPRRKKHQWDSYARVYASVQTSFQHSLLEDAARFMQGRVLDVDCGTAKIIPLIAEQPHIQSYTGIDESEEMLFYADALITAYQNDHQSFTTWCGSLDALTDQSFDAAVSLNGYFSWPDAVAMLSQIYCHLSPDSIFVIATPNASLTRRKMEALDKEAAKDLQFHPHYQEFKNLNLQLVDNPDARFVDMDTLVGELRHVGFKIVECHQQHYLGGMNFVVALKTD